MDEVTIPAKTVTQNPQHRCDSCGEPATACYREGRGTGHSEHVCACAEHGEDVTRYIPFT